MRNLIMFYLLAKSALKKKFVLLDILWAYTIAINTADSPDWLHMIGNMPRENTLPEAFNDFRITLIEKIGKRWFKK